MAMYRVWFDHHDGPYCTMIIADSEQDIEEVYNDDPFFLCVVPADSDFRPTGRLSLRVMSAEALGEEVCARRE